MTPHSAGPLLHTWTRSRRLGWNSIPKLGPSHLCKALHRLDLHIRYLISSVGDRLLAHHSHARPIPSPPPSSPLPPSPPPPPPPRACATPRQCILWLSTSINQSFLPSLNQFLHNAGHGTPQTVNCPIPLIQRGVCTQDTLAKGPSSWSPPMMSAHALQS